jgi:hypothetical protein
MDEEQSQTRRPAKRKTGEQSPITITPAHLPRLSPPASTDDALDEGYTDLPRNNSSIRRYSNPQNPQNPQNPRTAGIAPMNTPPMRRQTGPRNSDNREPGRQTGPRNSNAYETDRQGGSKETNAGRQTGSRANSPSYAAGRQTTRNIPSSQTRDYPRTQNKSRNAAPGKTRDLPELPRKRVHWFLPVGIGMLAMLALWLLGTNIVGWGTQVYNDFHYGNPRTYQVDAVVGHNHDSKAHPSHFIAMNLNRQAVVIEVMAGDPQKAITYVVPGTIAGDGGDRVPVTVEFRDVTHDHLVDMIVHIHLPSQDQISIFINDGTKFRPSTSTDKIYLS